MMRSVPSDLSMSSERRAVRTFDVTGWTIDQAVAAKGSTTISVCLPSQNEEATVGPIVAAIRTELVERHGLVDELIVIDDNSSDATAAVAQRAGATVFPVHDLTAGLTPGRGKGNVLWASLLASKGDLVVWCDADLTSFTPSWVTRLVAPLLQDPSVQLVKALYDRPVDTNGDGGGRTTELMARPLLSLLYPGLSGLAQPLGGEMAARRTALEELTFVQGWGVEVAILVDLLDKYGSDAIAQVDLGVRRHHHRPLSELSVQAAEIALTLLLRSGRVDTAALEHVLRRPDGTTIDLNIRPRPPITTLGS